MRTFSPEVESALDSGIVSESTLVTLFLNGATLRYCDWPVDITLSGNTYLSTGALMDVPILSTNEGEPITTGSLTLSNIGGTFNTIFRDTNQVFTPVTIHVVLVDAAGQAIGVLQTRKLYIESVDQVEDLDADSYTLKLSNHLVDFEATRGRTTSEASQKKYASDLGIVDTAMRHTNVLKSVVPWGKK